MLQQVFVPASKGLIKSAPSSLIPDGSFQEAVNVRFGDGYVEKVETFQQLQKEVGGVQQNIQLTHLDNGQTVAERVMKIHAYRKKSGQVKNIVHTDNAVYLLNALGEQPTKLSDDNYVMSEFGHISCVNAFDEYFFTSLGSDIYYWNTDEQKIRRLEGTFEPLAWQAGHAYAVGDYVRPTYENYTGFIYKCTAAGTSGSSEPTWTSNMVDFVVDGEDVRWIACGSLELEGQDEAHANLRANCVELFKGFLFLGNTEEGGASYPTRLRWSQWQNPRLWHNNEDGSGMSGYVDIDDTDGKIMALKRIGDVLYIYKENSIIALTYTGDADAVFSKEVVTTKAGLIAPEAIVELPHINIFISEDDIYMFDGNTCTGIGESIKEWFFNKFMDKTYLERMFGYYDEKNQEVIFCFNAKGDTSQGGLRRNAGYGIVYNLRLKTWSVREMGITAIGKIKISSDTIIDDVNTPYDDESNDVMIDSAIYAGAEKYTAAGDNAGNLYILDGYTDTRKQGGYDGYVVTKTHHMEEPGKVKRLMRIQFHIETAGDYDLYCQVGSAWSPENANSGDITWSEKKYLNLKKPVPWYTHHIVPYIDIDLTARYFMLRFGTTGNATYFKVLGYTLYYQVRGDE